MIKIGIVDDHQLFVKSLVRLFDDIAECNVVLEALNGKEMVRKLALPGAVPDILLIDVNMPQMDGAATASYMREHHPAVKMVVLSMNSDDHTILKMLRMGCCAYLLKDIHPNELETAIFEIDRKGFYNADAYNLNARRLLLQSQLEGQLHLTQRELEFLRLACSDLTYKQIAAAMFVSERTVDGYRDSLFLKLKVQSRVGMALEGLRQNLVTL